MNIHELTLNLESSGITEEKYKSIKRLFTKNDYVDFLNIVGDVSDVADVVEKIRKTAADRGTIIRNVNIVASCN